jgi:metal-sulfur cluster biosynthetic enzyme
MDELVEALRDVDDPEMPINIVDLGIVYGVRREPGHAGRVVVDLTFTAMGCPAADFILEDVRDRLLREPEVQEVVVNVVWDPPWTSARLTQAGREALEMWGLAV